MPIYQTKTNIIKGTSYGEVYGQAWEAYLKIKKQTKRRAYIRAAYWEKEKIFFDYFWEHLRQKNPQERMRRLRFFDCAVELLKHNRYAPAELMSKHIAREIFYRFGGKAKTGEKFFVQIKQNKKTGAKYFMSCFPEK